MRSSFTGESESLSPTSLPPPFLSLSFLISFIQQIFFEGIISFSIILIILGAKDITEKFLPLWHLHSNGLMDKNGLNMSIEISLAGW